MHRDLAPSRASILGAVTARPACSPSSSVDVPGADESQVDVRVENDMLIVQGSRGSRLEESEPGSYVRRERHSGRFERRLALPNDADASSLRTEYEEGVLRITLQKLGENG